MLDFSINNLSTQDDYVKILQQSSFDNLFELMGNIPLPINGMSVQMQKVQKLLSLQLPIDTLDTNGATLLMWASAKGYTTIVDLLLENRANPEIHDRFGNTALINAVLNARLNTVQFLLYKDVNVERYDAFGNTPLAIAVCRFVYDNSNNNTPIFYAIIKALLNKGANAQVMTNSFQYGHYSLVNIASRKHEHDLSDLLINNIKRKNPNYLFEDEFSFAVNVNHDHAVSTMLKFRPALLDQHDDYVYKAAKNFRTAMVGVLLKYTTPLQRQRLLDHRDVNGATALLIAFRMNKPNIAQHLLHNGDDLSKLFLTDEGKTLYNKRVQSNTWITVLHEYAKLVKKHEATAMLTEKVADAIYHNALNSGQALKDIQLPPELEELCNKTPERLNLYHRYKPSSQIRAFIMGEPYAICNELPVAKKRRF
jgi:ankyrin repeat protein